METLTMTMLRAWGPVINAIGLQNTLDDMLYGTHRDPASASRRPAFDLYETAEEFVLRAWLPGVGPDDLEITFDKGVLTLKAPITAPDVPAEKVTWHRRELGQGRWELSFRLPRDLDAERADASYEQGVLTLRLPKVEASRPRPIQVRTIV
jgi:HSP20 family protein